jgi:putative DNA primase/helicase
MAVELSLCKLGQHLDSHDKDTYRRAVSAWIVEFGEIETTFRSDLERLKAFITNAVDEYRLPYGRSDQTLARRSVIIGTCNSTQFLIDPSGSRRFWTVPVSNINLEVLSTLDMLQLWLQVDKETKHDPQGFRLTKDEQAALAERNTDHEKPLPAQLEVMDVLTKQSTFYREVTVSEFKEAHTELRNYSADQISKVLTKLGIEQRRVNVTVNGKRKTMRVRTLPMWKPAMKTAVEDDNPFLT